MILVSFTFLRQADLI